MSMRWVQAVTALGAAGVGVAVAALAVGNASVDNGCVESQTGADLAWALVFLALTLGIAAVVAAVWVALRIRHVRVAVGFCAAAAALGVVALIIDWAAAAASLDLCFGF